MRGVSPVRYSARPSSAAFPSQKPLFRLIQNALAGAVHEPQRAIAVNREDGDVHFLHHFAKKRRSFESAQALLAKRFAKRVHFAQHFAECVAFIGSARANRKIAFAQRSEKIRKRTKRKHHAALRGKRKAQPRENHQHGERPLQLRGIAAGP